MLTAYCLYDINTYIVSKFSEFKPRLKSPKNRFQFSAIEKFNTILSGTNSIWAQIL